jgi:hypothetical protein
MFQGKYLIELLRLMKGTRKAVEDASVGICIALERADHDLDDQVVRHELPGVDDLADSDTKLRASLNVPAEFIARGEMRKPGTTREYLCLSSFTDARCTKENEKHNP